MHTEYTTMTDWLRPNNSFKPNLDFPQFSGHASITLQEEKYDAGDDHGEENSAVQH